MADSKIKKLEKQLKKNLADKAKAKDSKKLAITKKIKKIREELKVEREKTKGLASRSTKGMNYGATTKAKRQTDRQSGDSRTKRPSQTRDIGGEDTGSKVTGFRDKIGPNAMLGESMTDSKKPKGGKATVSPNQKSRQASLPKDKDSFCSRLAKAMGDKRSKREMVRDREMNEKDEEEMGRNKGGAIKKKYGMRAGGFTKRGGMYKKGY
jgi:hypothetical protein